VMPNWDATANAWNVVTVGPVRFTMPFRAATPSV
jgi:hypothetical protein